jgi:hypothetical protein
MYPISSRFERVMPNESDYDKQIRQGFEFVQKKEADAHGKYLRGTHAKGVCVAGEVEIFDVAQSAPTVANRLKKGIFSVPGRYPAQVRFANAVGKIAPDIDKDVRAVSFSMQMSPNLSNPQGVMDFAMNDNPVFPFSNAQVFADVLQILQKRILSCGGIERCATALIAGVNGSKEQEKPGTTPYQKLRYWSTVPFALGADEAVKYSLKPCVNNAAQPLSNDPNALSQELIRNVQNDQPSCFEFQVQLLEAAKMTDPKGRTQPEYVWVENALMDWPEAQAPFYTVGRLTLTPNSVVDPETCERRHVNVMVNTNSIHHGLGSINRARTMSERFSAETRLKH